MNTVSGADSGGFPGLVVATFAHRAEEDPGPALGGEPVPKSASSSNKSRSEIETAKLLRRLARKPPGGRAFIVEDLASLAKRANLPITSKRSVGELDLESLGFAFATELPLREDPNPQVIPPSVAFVASQRVGEEVFRREFALVPNESLPSEADLTRLQLHVLTILGYRRSELFSPDLYLRLFSVALPPGRLRSSRDEKSSFLIFPLLHLVRRTNGTGFRRLFSVSLILIPRTFTKTTEPRPRPLLSQEIDSIRRELTSLTSPGSLMGSIILDGPLSEFLGSKTQMSLGELADSVLYEVHNSLFGSSEGSNARSLHGSPANLTRSRVESCVTDANVEVDWPMRDDSAFPWEDWLAGKEDPNLEKKLFELLRYGDSVSTSPHSTARGLRLRALSTNDEFGLDTDVLQLFDPQTSLRLMIQHQKYEGSTTTAVVWSSFGWYLFTNVTLASLKEVIRSYHAEMETQTGLASMLEVSREFLDTIDEFYDLDIRQHVLKLNYEKARHISGLDQDYRSLRESVSVLESEMAVDSTFKLNKLIFAFTIVNVSIVLYELVASRTSLPVSIVLAIGLLIAALVGPGAYLAYDRIGLALRSIGHLMPSRRAGGRSR